MKRFFRDGVRSIVTPVGILGVVGRRRTGDGHCPTSDDHLRWKSSRLLKSIILRKGTLSLNSMI